MSRKVFRSLAVVVLLLSALASMVAAQGVGIGLPPPTICSAVNVSVNEATAWAEHQAGLLGWQINGSATYDFDCGSGNFTVCRCCLHWEIWIQGPAPDFGWSIANSQTWFTSTYGCSSTDHSGTYSPAPQFPMQGDGNLLGVDNNIGFKVMFCATPYTSTMNNQCPINMVGYDEVSTATGTTPQQ